MDTETQIILEGKSHKNIKDELKEEIEESFFKFDDLKNYFYIAILIVLLICLIIFVFLKNDSSNNSINFSNSNNKVTLNGFEEFHANEFDENALLKYKQQQKDFCDNQEKFLIREYEDKLELANVSFLSQLFPMYVYKNDDYVSKEILMMENWKGDETNNLLTALIFYSSIKRLARENIYVLDIGSNVGWYSLFIARYGYNILSFEPSEINYYISKKNYCLNTELNITFINKGLYSEDRNCDLYTNSQNVGDGYVFCDNVNNLVNLSKTGEASLTKLSNYETFLINHNLGLVKIDSQGCDGKIIEGGIKLITKYHVPFIFLEFRPESLIQHGTNPRDFLKLFTKNGYKIAWYNFFSDDYLSIDEIMERANGSMSLYIVNSRTIRKYHQK